jgi:hypothetical protein
MLRKRAPVKERLLKGLQCGPRIDWMRITVTQINPE